MLRLPGYTFDELLADGAQSRVYAGRRNADAEQVVAKVTRGSRDLAFELELTRRVAGPGVVEVFDLVETDLGPALLQKRFGDGTLASLLRSGPLPVAQALRVALQLCAALTRVHAARVINRDIKPSNVLLDSQSGALALADFGVAAELPVGARSLPPSDLVGTPTYISPEQTGRTREGVDVRSDLYSFGVLLYEALTGKPPFESSDTLELLAAHLSRVPDAPAQRARWIPPVLSTLVMKLLAKSPAERYQTASGVGADLRRCLETLASDGSIPEFVLGGQDTVALRFPARLFGRDAELSQLGAAFEHARSAEPSLVLVHGPEGSGRAELTRAFAATLTRDALYASANLGGASDRPVAALSGALGELAERLLLLDDEALSSMRRRLAAQLGNIGRVITEVVPAFADVLGPQEPLPPLGAAESRIRFQLAFRRLLAALGEEGGLILAFDHLERADASSRALLEALVSAADAGKLLLVLATPDADAFGAMTQHARAIIELGPLPLSATSEWLAEVVACDVETARPLAEVLQEKSHGHAAFLTSLLEHLADTGVLHRVDGRWTWSLEAVRDAAAPPSLAALAATRIGGLSEERRRALEAVVCHAGAIEVATLAQLRDCTPASATEWLASLAREGLVTRGDTGYAVAHPAISESVLARMSPSERSAVYTRLGRHWLKSHSDAELAQHAYRVATTLQQGDLDLDEAERVRAARCFLAAAERATSTTAYVMARAFFASGQALLGAADWASQPELMFALAIGHARSLAMLGQTAEAETAFAALCARPLPPRLLAAAYGSRTDNFQGVMDRERAVEAGLEGLARLGVRLPKRPSELRPLPALLRNQYQLAKLTAADILSHPPCTDEHALAVGELIGQMIAPAFFFDPNLFVLLNEVALAYYLKHGHTPAAVFLLGSHSMVLNGALKKYADAYALVEAVDALLVQRPAPAFVAKALVGAYHFTAPLYRSWRELAAKLADGVSRGLESGDAIFAAYCAVCELNLVCLSGAPLEYVLERCQVHARAGAKGEGAVAGYMALVSQVAAKLLAGEALGAADLDPISAVSRAAGSIRNEAMTGLGHAVLAAGHEQTVRAWLADIAPSFEKVCFAAPTKLDLWQLEGYFAACDARAGQRGALRRAERALAKMKSLRGKTRAPVAPRIHLLEGDIAHARGDSARAAEEYGRAAASAREHEYVHILAFAQERRAQLLSAQGRQDEATLFYREALSAYRRWGHLLKVRQLEAAHPELKAQAQAARTAGTVGGATQTTTNEALDLGTVLKVSQQISTQLHASGVVRAVLAGVAENAGAQRAVLVLRDAQGAESVYAQLDHGTYSELGVPFDAYADLPKTLVRLVRRNGKPVVVADAASDPGHGSDPFVREQRCRSLACVPIARKGEVVGFVVLENRLVAGAFSVALIEITHALVTQAAISLDNAALYTDMEGRVQERTAALNARNRQMRMVLDNVAEGLVVTDRGGLLSAERSAVIASWFERGVPETLGELFEQYAPERKPWFDLAWSQLLDGFMPLAVSIDQLPKSLRLAEREIEIAWRPIADDTGGLARMLVVLSDVTELRRQQRAEAAQKEALALLERLTRDREGVLEFGKEVSAMIGELREGRGSVESERRIIHTLKGNFALFGLSSLSARCHELETTLEQEQRGLGAEERESLAQVWLDKTRSFQRFLTAEDDVLQVHRQDYEAALRVLRRDGHALAHDLELWTLEPIKVRFQRIGEQADALAQRLGKGALELRIEHAGIRLEADRWARFWASFVHAVRNAIDHGIEPEAERDTRGKGRATLRLSASLEGDRFVVECADDGRGVDWERLRDKARSRGLPADSASDLTRALFADGVSTRDEVSALSGRGVGMAALAEACAAMGGEIQVLSERGVGTTIRFVLPAALAHVPRERWVSVAPAQRHSVPPAAE